MSTKDGTIRGHQPIKLSSFNGLWDRGNPEEVPLDHFRDLLNIDFYGSSGFRTRDGIGITQGVEAPLSNILRAYNYPTQNSNDLIVLIENSDGDGEIYHVAPGGTTFGPLLTITGMTDFSFIPYAGRAYISPFSSFPDENGELFQEKGLEGEFLYVYLGDGTAARKAAGSPPSGTLSVADGAAGNTDAGDHIFGAVFESDTGWLSAPGVLVNFETEAAKSVTFTNIPTSGNASVTKVHIVASKVIEDYNGDLEGYQLFFIPGATVDNGTTSLADISFFDADLLEDASHLLDNYEEIPAGAVLGLYHNRLCLAATFDDISIALVSAPGEPEAISQIDGIIIVPLDGNPITNLQELRDVLYITKRNRTASYIDNEDEPSSWPLTFIDQALGSVVHGIATVLDSGSSSVDYLLVANYKGINIFSGQYSTPELTWKIQNFWASLDRNEFRQIQMLNDSINQRLYVVVPSGFFNILLVGDWKNGLDPKNIRWTLWNFYFKLSCVAQVNIDQLIVGGTNLFFEPPEENGNGNGGGGDPD